MKGYMIRKLTVVALTVGAALTPAVALADTITYFNDGNGTCGYVDCGAYGCQVIDTFPCPRELGTAGGGPR